MVEIGAMFLDLPPELIQQILSKCSTRDFLEVALSCRTVYGIASSCRGVILYHLRQTPGTRNLDTQSYSSKRLFHLLAKYAFRQLYGSQFHSVQTAFDFGYDRLDVKASTLDSQILALAIRGQQKVHLFRIRRGRLQLICRFSFPWDHPGAVDVLKTTFDGDNGFYILQRFTPGLDGNEMNARHPFVKQAMQSNSNGIFYLSQYSLRSPNDPVRICAFPDHSDYEPLALAATPGGNFAISWQLARDYSEHEVVLYTAQIESNSGLRSGVVDFSYSSCVLLDGRRHRCEDDRSIQSRSIRDFPPHGQGPVVGLAFNDRSSQLLYRYRAETLYSSFQMIEASHFPIQPTLYRNSCPTQFTGSLTLLFSIGVPFYGTHETRVQNGFATCHWKYLSFGIATHREEGWTVACLMKSSAVCRADWTIVARLWGFQNPSSSLGCIVAASRLGTRIAVANWKTIYIWALEPNALIEQNATGFYPPSSWPVGSEVIELRPMVLSLEAVCFQLCFAQNENELVALTDKGLMSWDLSPSGRGQKISHQMRLGK
ncbi:hypothetical protein BO71DRAFT_453528 [Aspergillus ellipticus CBS 707.79]|uniref:F-box domain-containing protein n=1 Tax=Aspergillus ellipticus CBS 707.79 TaxID=1448320 RepID=A0A319CWQ0_9EURO|nr:hypothetical protein BO71DRAFT_453528 [Aspergillus ellipticus CBS 707.79]